MVASDECSIPIVRSGSEVKVGHRSNDRNVVMANRVRAERGSTVPMMVTIIALISIVSVVLARSGQAFVERARVDVFADSVALATAGGGEVIGRAVADANGVDVVEVEERHDGSVRVEITYRGHRSIAAARLGPG